MFRGGPEHSGVYPGGGVDGFAGVKWRFQTAGAVRASVTVADNVAFVGSTDGQLYALDATLGEELWHFDGGSPVVSTAAVAAGLVFYGDRAGVLRALDRTDGTLRWDFPTGPDTPLPWGNEGWDYYTSSPTVLEDIVLFGSRDGSLYAVEAETGSELWRYPTEGQIWSSPAVADGTVFVGSADGSLHAVDLASGEPRWRYDTDGRSHASAEFGFDRRTIQSSPSVADGRVFFGSRDGHVYAVEAETGSLAWRFDQEVSWCVTSPAVESGVVYAGSSDGNFAQALDAQSGEELWRAPTEFRVFASPALSGETVLVADHAGVLFALDRRTGAERWRFRAGQAIQSSPVVANGVVYVGSDDGFVYAIDGTDGPSLRRAVFWDASVPAVYPGHEALRDHLASSGYEVLDAEALADFMIAREADAQPSVVVFAKDQVPQNVAATAADTVLLRRYLDGGGRVVWLGYPPFALVRDPDTGAFVAVDMDRPEEVLGVDHSSATGDEYAAWATDAGSAWGLPDMWLDGFGVDPADVTTVLASDERGRATAWVRRYSDAPGGGFVRLWGRLDAIEDPAIVQRVAESGLR
jgi:outer membrane protein assembly factor BamB